MDSTNPAAAPADPRPRIRYNLPILTSPDEPESWLARERRIAGIYEAAGFAFTARCCCYDGHASASGRCHATNVWHPAGKAPICEPCANGCGGAR